MRYAHFPKMIFIGKNKKIGKMIQKFQFPDNQLRMFLVESQVILIIKTECIVARKIVIREQLIVRKHLFTIRKNHYLSRGLKFAFWYCFYSG